MKKEIKLVIIGPYSEISNCRHITTLEKAERLKCGDTMVEYSWDKLNLAEQASLRRNLRCLGFQLGYLDKVSNTIIKKVVSCKHCNYITISEY